MTNTCVICDRPSPDGYACVACAVDRPRQLLVEIQDMLPAATDVAHRQARHGASTGGHGKPGSALPIDLGATARLDGVRTALTTWARHIAEERGVTVAGDGEPILVAARWLADHCEWMRHREECPEFLGDVEACARIVRGIARGPADRVYLGPCGAPEPECNPIRCASDCPVDCGMGTCDGDVYGLPDGDTGRCRECGAEYDQRDRRTWLDEQVSDKAFRASHIADAYGINVNTIRSWALDRPEVRAKNGNLIQRARPAKLREHGRDRFGKPLYLVGDVLELARKAATQRAESEARRAVLESAGQSVQ